MSEETELAHEDRHVVVSFLEDDMRLIEPALKGLSLERFVHRAAMKLAASTVLTALGHMEVPDMLDLVRMSMTEAKVAHWDDDLQLTFAEELMHLQEELAEVFMAWRQYHDFEVHYDRDRKPRGVPIELADILLGLFYNVGLYDINIVKAIQEKHDFNLTRDYRTEGRQLHRPSPKKSTMRIVDATTVTGVGEDDFAEAFQEAVDGGAFQVQDEAPEHPVVDLMNALETSLAKTKETLAKAKETKPDEVP
jgi:NTP pyrophosphatase (non-canonical NTP hydrolase)